MKSICTTALFLSLSVLSFAQVQPESEFQIGTTFTKVKVDKDSGKDVVKIPFGDKDPAYIVDEAENKLYVVIKDKFVQSYDLNAK